MPQSPVEYIELNLSNYSADDVAQLNQWAIWAAEELERYRNPMPGDLEQQAAAWVAVHWALVDVGLEYFLGSMPSSGRQRACEFIRHLGEQQ